MTLQSTANDQVKETLQSTAGVHLPTGKGDIQSTAGVHLPTGRDDITGYSWCSPTDR